MTLTVSNILSAKVRPTPPECAGGVTGAVVGDRLVLIGGALDADTYPGRVQLWQSGSAGWTDGAPMPTARHNVSAAVIGSKVFVVSGLVRTDTPEPGTGHPSTPSAAHEVYDVEADRWQRLGALPEPRVRPVVELVNGELIVLGGRGAADNAKIGLAWSPETDTWRELGEMPFAVRHPAGCRLGNEVILSGGWSPDDSARGAFHSGVHAFNPKTGAWRRLADMPEARAGHELVNLDGRLYAIGGLTRDDGGAKIAVESVDVYAPEADAWVRLSGALEPRTMFAAGVLDGRILLAAGWIKVNGPRNESAIALEPSGDVEP